MEIITKKINKKNIMAKQSSEYIESAFCEGYMANREITNIASRFLVKGSQNVLIKNKEKIVVRSGTELLGDAKTVSKGIKSSVDWETNTNVTRNLRKYYNELEVWYGSSWINLMTGLKAKTLQFAPWWSTTELIDELIFVDGSDTVYEWSGGIAEVASVTSNTITKKKYLVGTTYGFVNGGAGVKDTITDSANGFVTAGFAVGDDIIISGSTSNDGQYTISAVVAGTLTLIADDELTTEAAGDTVVIRKLNEGSWAEARFLTAGTRKVTIDGTEYTYTGGEDTGTLTGVTPNPMTIAQYKLTNTDVTYAAGKINNGAVFNGSSSKLNGSCGGKIGGFTASIWLKPTTGVGNIMTFGDGTYNLRMWLHASGANTVLEIDQLAGEIGNITTQITPDVWQLFTVSYDGTTQKTYVDGELKTTNSVAYTMADFTTVQFGGDTGGYYDGMLDEAGIWNRVLTQAEITALYNSGDGTQHRFDLSSLNYGVVAYYRLDEASGDAYNSTGIAEDRDYAIQTVRESSPTALDSMDIDLISVLNNHVYYGSTKSRVVNISKTSDFADCSYTAPLRVAGEGWTMDLDSCPKAFMPNKVDMHIGAGNNDIYKVVLTLNAAQDGESITVEKITTSTGQAPINQDTVINIKNNVVFLTVEKTIDSLGSVENVPTPETRPISDDIKDDLALYDLTDASGIYFNREIRIALPREGIELIYDMQWGYWQPPQLRAIGRYAIIEVDGVRKLCGHSARANETYILDTGRNDNGATYKPVLVFGYERYATRFDYKTSDEFATELYINKGTKVIQQINYDYRGSTDVREFVLDPDDTDLLFERTDDASLGAQPLGNHPLGMTTEEMENLVKMRVINTTEKVDFFERQRVYYSDSTDPYFEILGMAENVEKSDTSSSFIKR